MALESFAHNLWIETGDRIGVQTIAPGAIRTRMHERSGASPAALNWEHFPPPDVVARQVVGAIDGHKRDTAIGVRNRLLRFGGRYLPGFVDRLAERRKP